MSVNMAILSNMASNGNISKTICSTTYVTPFHEYTVDISNREEPNSMFSDVSLGRNTCIMDFKDSIQSKIKLEIPSDNIAMVLDNFYESLCNNHPSKYIHLYIDQETGLYKIMGLYIPDNYHQIYDGLWEFGIFDYNIQNGDMIKRLSFQSTTIGITDLLDALYYVMFFDIRENQS